MSSATKRIGIFGGTFDPIHLGHIQLANKVIELLKLDEVLLIPTANPNFKQGQVHASVSDRLAMCQLATAHVKKLTVSNIEAIRKGVTYTIDTVRELKEMYGPDVELIFILGSDSAMSLQNWKGASELSELISFLVVPRIGDESFNIDELSKAGFDVDVLDVEVPEVSSTQIRDAIKKGHAISGLVHPDVESYIYEKQLYN